MAFDSTVTQADATSGVWNSQEYTLTSTGKVTLAIWGDVGKLTFNVQISTYVDGDTNDVWVDMRSQRGGFIENIFLDEGVKLRVQVRGWNTDNGESFFVTTGGGNTE